MSADIDLTATTITELAEAMVRGDMTSVQLVQRYLARISRLEPALGALTEIFADQALKDAVARDRARAGGQTCGPLHGIPVLFKDLVDIAGRRTTAGSELFAGYVARRTATIVMRLESAGMVTVGKTCMVELAFGAWGTNRLVGTPHNPWDHERKRMPGGSSSGTAVAVAAAFGPAGIGTDTGGSVRIPAAMCGVVGFKPTQGKVPVDGLTALSPTLDTVGPITRTVADSALVYDELAGTAVANGLDVDHLLPDRARCRVGILPGHALCDVEADVANAYSDTIDTLAAIGADVEELSLDQPFETLARKNGDLIAYEAWQIHGERIRAAPECMNPEVRARFRAGEGITREEFQAAVEERERLCREMAGRMDGIDVLMTPTTPISAIEVADVDETSLLISQFTRPINYLGLCALAVPCGLDTKGLPLSVQFVCAPGGDATVLNVGAAYERARGVFPTPDL